MNHINVWTYIFFGACAALIFSVLVAYFFRKYQFRISAVLSILFGVVMIFTRLGGWAWGMFGITMPRELVPPDLDNGQLQILFLGWFAGVCFVIAARGVALKFGV